MLAMVIHEETLKRPEPCAQCLPPADQVSMPPPTTPPPPPTYLQSPPPPPPILFPPHDNQMDTGDILKVLQAIDCDINHFYHDHASFPEQAPPSQINGHLDQWRKLGCGKTWIDDLSTGKVPPTDLLGSSPGAGAHKAESPQRSQVRQSRG